MLLAFVCFRAASDETELPTPNHPAVHDPSWTLSIERDLGRLEAQVKRKGSRLKTAAEIGLAVGAVTLPANANFGLIAGNRA